MSLTAKRLREVLRYDPQTGQFTWLVRLSIRILIGRNAGRINRHGYRIITIDCVRYHAHRLAWLYMTGEWPAHYIDHANLDKADNRFANLREASRQQNSANTKTPSNNRSGFKGVQWHPQTKKWRARIGFNGKHQSLGLFKSPEEAHAAYAEAAEKLFGEYARAS